MAQGHKCAGKGTGHDTTLAVLAMQQVQSSPRGDGKLLHQAVIMMLCQ